MRKALLLLALLIKFGSVAFAQVDTTQPKPSILIPDSTIITDSVVVFMPASEIKDSVIDPRRRNAYGDLLFDDPAYNRRYPWTTTALRVGMVNVANWAMARYLYKKDWAYINGATMKRNLRAKWVWDDDGFGTNFIGHPHSGNNYFNVARANGYNFWQSVPFAVGGSLMWEIFGENVPPSKNDIINTPISGAFLGEVLYRISSNILDDRARGGNRFLRELLAGLVNPPRALNRLTQGKMFRVTPVDVYQKEPLNITFAAGVHKVNAENKFATGETNIIANLQLDYGDPFEVRKRQPFDLFRLRLESRYGAETKFLDNVTGYGLLFGKNVIKGKHGTLIGFFQYFDYWNNKVFEIGALGFGPGIISRTTLGWNTHLYSGLHIAAVPFAGNNTRFGPDTSEFRAYNYGGGIEGRIDETLNLSKWFSLGFTGYYYWIHTYVGLPGNSLIWILKPRVTVNLTRNLSFGFEHHIYKNDRNVNDIPDLRLVRTEQKAFLQFYFEDFRRKGRYH
jgi:hypothetical protein